MGAADIVAILRADTAQFTAKMDEAQAKVAVLGKAGASSFEKLAAVGKYALLATAAAAVGVGAAAVDFGNKYEDAQAQLVNAFKNAGTSVDKFKGQIGTMDSQMAKYGYNSATVNGTLAQLVTVTGNAQESINVMGLAADIAANRHMDLNTAGTLLAKTLGGNLTAAKRMGIEIPAAVTKIKDPTEKANAVLAILEGRFKGSAAAAADTFTGRLNAMKAQGENLLTVIGLKLIPVLEKLMTQTMQLVNWFERHKAIAEALAITLGVILVAAISLYIGSMIDAAVTTVEAMTAADVAMAGIPILIGLLVIAAVYLSSHWKQVWDDIKQWVADGVEWIRSHLLLVIAAGGPIGLMIAAAVELGSHWQFIFAVMKNAVADAWAFIKPIFDLIKDEINGVRDVVDAVAGPLSSLTHLGSSMLGGVSHLFGFAAGGPVVGGQPIVVGEKGPEIWVPPGNGTILSNAALQANSTGNSPVTTGGNTVNVFAQTNADPDAIAAAVGWKLKTMVA